MNDRLKRAAAPVTWLHEFMHYVAARALGVKAEIQGDRMVTEPASPWKNVVITLVPVIPGVVVFVLSLIGWANTGWGMTHPDLAWSCGAWVGFWWVAACYYDFVYVWKYLRSGQWPEVVKWEGGM
jgi:hypothetical protein